MLVKRGREKKGFFPIYSLRFYNTNLTHTQHILIRLVGWSVGRWMFGAGTVTCVVRAKFVAMAYDVYTDSSNR